MADLLSTLVGGSGALSSVGQVFNVIEQRKWNERAEANAWDMYQTERRDAVSAHQTAAKDLKAAGLNPVLAASKGAASPVATGQAASAQSPNIAMPDLMNIFATAKGLEQRDREIGLAEDKLKLDALNSATERAYKGVLTKNERYGVQGMMSDFFRELKNEEGQHLNLNDIMNYLKKFGAAGLTKP